MIISRRDPYRWRRRFALCKRIGDRIIFLEWYRWRLLRPTQLYFPRACSCTYEYHVERTGYRSFLEVAVTGPMRPLLRTWMPHQP